jgi:hypothetical protein
MRCLPTQVRQYLGRPPVIAKLPEKGQALPVKAPGFINVVVEGQVTCPL